MTYRSIGGILRLARSDKIGIECLFQQRLRACVVTCTDRRNRLLLERRNLRILAGQGFDLLEQRQVLRRNLAQLGIQILDWDFLLAQDPEEIRHRHVGDAEPLGEPFVLRAIRAEWPGRPAQRR